MTINGERTSYENENEDEKAFRLATFEVQKN